MDDKRIEDLLRDSCRSNMPGGMKDRVMRAARQELAHQRRPRVASRWRPALAALALAIVLLMNIADLRLQSRLQALTDGMPAHNMTTPVLPGILKLHHEMAGMLAQVPVGLYPGGVPKGDEPL